jgi:general secretion pathway protein L
VFSKLNGFLHWWLAGLRYLRPSGLAGRKPSLPAHLLITVNADDDAQLALQLRDEHGKVTDHREQQGARAEHALQSWLSPHLENGLPIVLRLPKEQTLTPLLKLPRVAGKDLRHLLSFELGRQTPFSNDQVYYDYYTRESKTEADKLDVTLVVVRRSSVHSQLERLKSLGITPTIIDAVGASQPEHEINLSPPAETTAHSANGFGLRLALYALASLLFIGVVTVSVSQTESAIETLRAELAARKSEIKVVEALKRDYEQRRREANFFVDLDNDRLRTIDLLAEVTRLLPDHSWLNRFELKDGKGQFRGESENASGLIPLFEESAYFREVQFGSPVTRNNTTGRDRFFLSTQVGEAR